MPNFVIAIIVAAVVAVVFLKLADKKRKKAEATTGPAKMDHRKKENLFDYIAYSAILFFFFCLVLRTFRKLTAIEFTIVCIFSVIVSGGIYLVVRSDQKKEEKPDKKKGGTLKRSWWSKIINK